MCSITLDGKKKKKDVAEVSSRLRKKEGNPEKNNT